VCTHLSIYVEQIFYNKIFGYGDSDVVLNSLVSL